jgi:DNA repair exonuclease SbcCD ATPase subunit
MKTRPGFALIIALLFAAACSSKMEPSEVAGLSETTASATTVSQAADVVSDLYSNGITKLIKTANYRFEVDNVQKSIDAIEVAMRKYNAFISSSALRLDNPMIESKMTIRVQNEYFQELLKEIDKQARFVNFRDIKTEDVSKQFVDLESRLKSKREVEQRYMEILRKKTGTIEDLLKAEHQIGDLHEEIEATVSRINYLKDEVRYSTINLELYQRVEQVVAGNEATTLSDMQQALASGWRGLVAVLTGILYLWPLLILSAVATLLYRVSKRKPRLVKGI